MKIKIVFLAALALFGCKVKNEIRVSKSQDKPNVIVILIDDAGYTDFGFMGSKDLQTPNIDQLAAESVVFTDAHVSATVCAPSRAGLLTGKYQQRFGFEANGTGYGESGELGLPANVTTLADVFKENNYNTIALGKWHLGHLEDDHPNQRGFNEFYGFLDGGRSYFPLENPSEKSMLQQNGQQVKFEGYMTDVLGDRAVTFIEEQKQAPFFMYLAFNAVHSPMHAKKEHLEKFKDHPRKKLAAMTWSLDENVGKIVEKLKMLRKLDNTLIFFLSDNGGATYNQSDNGDLKGYKGNKYEAGHRVPFMVHWKNKIKGNSKFEGLTSSLDIFKTSIAAAGISEDAHLKLDGVDLMPYLKNEKQGNPHDKLFWRKLRASAVRIGNYKLINVKDHRSVLYNLKNDLGEINDLFNIDENTSGRLTKEFELWESGLVKPLWTEGDYWEKRNFEIHKNLMNNEYSDVKSQKEFIKKKKLLKASTDKKKKP